MAWVGVLMLFVDEDYALKQKLSGYSVSNYADGSKRPIPVYFRFPDSELRTRQFPHFAIDLVEVEFDAERMHRAVEYICNFDLETATPATGFDLIGDDMPLAISLVYQIAAYARQPWEDRQLMALLYMLFPDQYGSLDMQAFDGTFRRADFVSMVRRDTVDSEQKRLYRQIVTIAVSSEFFANATRYTQKIASTNISIVPYVNQPAVA
jgi:hypothetical protein